MKRLTNNELKEINGGISGALLSSILKGVSTLLDLGRSIGTALRRIQTKKICKL